MYVRGRHWLQFLLCLTWLACSGGEQSLDAGPKADVEQDIGPTADAGQDIGPTADAGQDIVSTADAGQDIDPTADVGQDTETTVAPANCVLSADLDDFIESRMQETNIPGLVVGIVSGGGLLWAKGYGFADIAASRPVTKDTIFAMMSISKVVTSVGVMQLVESNQIDLDADINDYLLEFSVIHPTFPVIPMTTGQLLTHTSGLAGDDYGVLQENIQTNDADVQPLGEMLSDLITPEGSRYDDGSNFSEDAPGTAWVYSSIGMSLAGYVAESVSGTGFDLLTTESIFQPLGMSNTSWRLAPYQDKLDQVAVMYDWDEIDQQYYDIEHFTFADYPAGSIRSSVSDFSRFLAAMINDGIFDGQRILSEASAAQMREENEVNYTQGLGWHFRFGARDLIGHGGDDAGASTDMWYDLNTGIGVIMLMNVTRRPNTDMILLRLIEETDGCQ